MQTFQRFDAISRSLLITLLALLPFFFVPTAWVTISQSKVLLIGVLLGLAVLFWTVGRISEGVVRVPLNVILLGAVLLPLAYALSVTIRGWNTVSLVGSGVEQDTLAAICMCSAILALFVFLFSDESSWIVKALRAIVCGATVMMLLQALHLAIPALPLSAVFAGNAGNAFGNWEEFSIALGFFLVMGLTLSESPVGKGYGKYLLYGSSLVSFLLLILGGSSGVWIALACVAFLSVSYRIYLLGPSKLSVQWKPAALWGALFIASVVFAIFGARVQSSLPNSFIVQSPEVRPSWQGTLAVGEKVLANPEALVFGAGPNTFTREWALYKPASINATPFWNSDFHAGVASLPTFLITVGFLGVAAWLIFIGVFVWVLTRAFLRRAQSTPVSKVAEALAFGSIFLLAFFALYVPGPALSALTFFSVGLFAAEMSASGRPRNFTLPILGSGTKEIAGTVALALGILAILWACSASVRITLAEALINESVIVYGSSQDMTRSGALINDALWFYSGDGRAHRAAVELGLLELQQLSVASDPKNDAAKVQLQSALATTIQQGLSAVSIDNADYQNWLELASLYRQLAGAQVPEALDNARSAYRQAQIANPTSPLPFYGLAQLDIISNDSAAALSDLSAAVKLKADFAPAYYLESQVYALQGDLAHASASAALAVQYTPYDPLAWYNFGAILYAQKNYADAATAEEKALSLNSRYANALYIEGLAYSGLNRPADSLKAFETLDTLDPGQSAVESILANLRKGLPPLPKGASAQ